MDKCFHYQRGGVMTSTAYMDLGLEYCVMGHLLIALILGPGRNYDWCFRIQTFDELRKLNINPIVDLCHFGVPDWVGNFQNPDWPAFRQLRRVPSQAVSHGSAFTHLSTRSTYARCFPPFGVYGMRSFLG